MCQHTNKPAVSSVSFQPWLGQAAWDLAGSVCVFRRADVGSGNKARACAVTVLGINHGRFSAVNLVLSWELYSKAPALYFLMLLVLGRQEGFSTPLVLNSPPVPTPVSTVNPALTSTGDTLKQLPSSAVDRGRSTQWLGHCQQLSKLILLIITWLLSSTWSMKM